MRVTNTDLLSRRRGEIKPDPSRGLAAFNEILDIPDPWGNWCMLPGYEQPDWVQEVHNSRTGRIFILGTGPSLAGQQELLKKLGKEQTWTVNRMASWKDLPFTPTYHSIAEPAPVGGWGRFIYRPYDFPTAGQRIAVHWFPVRAPGWLWVAKAADEIQIRWQGFFGLGASLPPLPTGWASPLTVAQVAAWMGYTEFIFLGVDCTQQGQAWNPVQGRTAKERNILAILESFDRAQAQIKKAGRTIWDCTPGGRLNREGVLPYLDLEEAIETIT